MRITRWAEYGILCSLYLASAYPDRRVGAAEIARAQGLPLKYTQQILHRLRRAGVIRSIRGPGGGYVLARPPGELSLKEVFVAGAGSTFELLCDYEPHPFCPGPSSCLLHPVWTDLQSSTNAVLEKYTLESLLGGTLIAGIGGGKAGSSL